MIEYRVMMHGKRMNPERPWDGRATVATARTASRLHAEGTCDRLIDQGYEAWIEHREVSQWARETTEWTEEKD